MENPKPSIDLSELTAAAAQGLVQMFDPATKLFCARLVRTPTGLIRVGQSPRYTIMTLLGLREREKAGLEIPFETQAIFRAFVSNTRWVRSIGDLGLLLWLIAEFDSDGLLAFQKQYDLFSAVRNFADGRQGSTTELSWFLAGLSHAARTSNSLASRLTDLAAETFRLTQRNQGRAGFFGHLSVSNSVRGVIRGRIGSFADQIYPIYAFSECAVSFHMDECRVPALKCAQAICNVQGAFGQWWWLYDSPTGRISSRYPVYSVHQHAMAPMGLFSVEKATGQSFQNSIYKGLLWIYGQNELGTDMRDAENNVVWRCIRPQKGSTKYWSVLSSFVKAPRIDEPVSGLEVLHEDWPYELGWLLYAFSNNELKVAKEAAQPHFSEVR
jgi:hypothetical protein